MSIKWHDEFDKLLNLIYGNSMESSNESKGSLSGGVINEVSSMLYNNNEMLDRGEFVM